MPLKMITNNIFYKFQLKNSVLLRLNRVVLSGGDYFEDEAEAVLLR